MRVLLTLSRVLCIVLIGVAWYNIIKITVVIEKIVVNFIALY